MTAAAEGRIDVHHHAILPEIAELMRRRGAPFRIDWTMESTREVMSTERIDAALISNAIPGDLFASAEEAVPFHRGANDAVAAFVARDPGRFGLLAAVPMPWRDAALAEIDHAFDVLGADGVVLVPHAGIDHLGDPAFAPVLAELDRRAATVLVHPMALPASATTTVPYVLADFLLDTTRGAISLMMSGALERYPSVRFVLAHAGGFLPYAASRVEWLGSGFFDLDPGLVRDQIGRFTYDTALTGAGALRCLFDVVPPEQVVVGTDWCAAPRAAVRGATAALDETLTPMPAELRRRVERGNALDLFPSLARRTADGLVAAGAPDASPRPRPE